MSTFTITALNGVSYAFILFLLAAGFSLTFGVMGVINLAHGALYVLGAYFGLAIISRLDGFWLGVVVAAAGAGLVGLAMYYFFLRHLYGKIPEQAVLTIGLSYAIANIILWVWGPFAKMGMTPPAFTGVVRIGTCVPHLPPLHHRCRPALLGLLGGCRTRPAWAPSSAPAWTTRR